MLAEVAIDESMYAVKWQGFPASENSWEPENSLSDESAPVEQLVEAYDGGMPARGEPKPPQHRSWCSR